MHAVLLLPFLISYNRDHDQSTGKLSSQCTRSVIIYAWNVRGQLYQLQRYEVEWRSHGIVNFLTWQFSAHQNSSKSDDSRLRHNINTIISKRRPSVILNLRKLLFSSRDIRTYNCQHVILLLHAKFRWRDTAGKRLTICAFAFQISSKSDDQPPR